VEEEKSRDGSKSKELKEGERVPIEQKEKFQEDDSVLDQDQGGGGGRALTQANFCQTPLWKEKGVHVLGHDSHRVEREVSEPWQ